MDVLQYRDTGEFSDLTIQVAEESFKLHKFPLLIKSEYIKEKASANSVSQLTLDAFPGGAKNFAQVADFCYGKRIDISVKNMVGLYCAAEYLQMTSGEGNLLAVTKRAIDEVLHSVRLSRSAHQVVDLLAHGADSVQPKETLHPVFTEVFDTLLDIWLRGGTGGHHSRGSGSHWSSANTSGGSEYAMLMDRLLHMDLHVLAHLVREVGQAEENNQQKLAEKEQNHKTKEEKPEKEAAGSDEEGKEKPLEEPAVDPPKPEKTKKDSLPKASAHPSHRVRVLADLVFRYLQRVFQLHQMETYRKNQSAPKKQDKAEREKDTSVAEKEPSATAEADKSTTEEATNEVGEGGTETTAPEGGAAAQPAHHGSKKRDDHYFADDSDDDLVGDSTDKKGKKVRKTHSKHFGGVLDEPIMQLKHNVGEYLDTLLEALPEQAPLSEVVNPAWLQQALQVAETEKLHCRSRLLQLCGTQLDRFTDEELRHMPPATLCEAISATVHDGKLLAPDVLTCVLDTHLKDMAKKGELGVEDFITIVKNIPESNRSSQEYNSMYEVLEEMLTSGVNVPDAQRQELFDLIDFSRCSEDNLQRALDKEIVPIKILCQAAIQKARRNRDESSMNGYSRNDYKFSTSDESPVRHRTSSSHLTSSKRPLTSHYTTPSLAGGNYSSSYNYGTSPLSSSLALDISAGSSGLGAGAYYPSLAGDYNYSSSGMGTTSYDTFSVAPSYRNSRAGGYDDSSLLAFEENLRGELNRISQNYDMYFKERQRRSKASNNNAQTWNSSKSSARKSGGVSSTYGW